MFQWVMDKRDKQYTFHPLYSIQYIVYRGRNKNFVYLIFFSFIYVTHTLRRVVSIQYKNKPRKSLERIFFNKTGDWSNRNHSYTHFPCLLCVALQCDAEWDFIESAFLFHVLFILYGKVGFCLCLALFVLQKEFFKELCITMTSVFEWVMMIKFLKACVIQNCCGDLENSSKVLTHFHFEIHSKIHIMCSSTAIKIPTYLDCTHSFGTSWKVQWRENKKQIVSFWSHSWFN